MSVNVSIRKNKGQYMTPAPITTMILDTIGYTGPQILTKTIMEPSFGDGSFLISIVQRVITEGERAGLSKSDIAQIINNNIFGIEKISCFITEQSKGYINCWMLMRFKMFAGIILFVEIP